MAREKAFWLLVECPKLNPFPIAKLQTSCFIDTYCSWKMAAKNRVLGKNRLMEDGRDRCNVPVGATELGQASWDAETCLQPTEGCPLFTASNQDSLAVTFGKPAASDQDGLPVTDFPRTTLLRGP